jgi:uncharacterized membrane protein
MNNPEEVQKSNTFSHRHLFPVRFRVRILLLLLLLILANIGQLLMYEEKEEELRRARIEAGRQILINRLLIKEITHDELRRILNKYKRED